MKIHQQFIVTFLVLGLFACSPEGEHKTHDQETVFPEKQDVLKDYYLVSDSSSVTWERYLHEGPTKKKMKLFGAEVEVEMGEVELNTTGEAKLNSGEMKEVNDEITSCILNFDMTTFKVNTNMENKSDDLFKANEYPESKLNFSEVVKNDTSYMLKGSLTIADVENPIEANATIIDEEVGKTLKGEFIINTLDWPLRDEEATKSTIKDEVTVSISLMFNI